jgi:large subunit ribosomal protein L21
MSMYAIIQLEGKQFKVQEGDEIIVDRLAEKEANTFETKDVLLVNKDGESSIGDPLVSGASVSLKVLNHLQGEKIRVATYKSKSRYRKVRGHRQQQTALQVMKISV